MAYQPYATVEDYQNVLEINTTSREDLQIEAALRRASRHIDTLTFNRILGRGFENLTEFQQEIIKEVCCRLASWEMENEDLITSILQGYAINGVSMQWGRGITIFAENGVVMPRDLYSLLIQTGLGCRMASGCVWG